MATAIKITPNWREQLGAKLVTPEEAVAHIKSGDRITASIAHATPFTLFHALAGRLMEIERVVVNYSAALFAFDLPGLGERFRLESFYLSPIDRKLFHDGMGEFVPVSYYRAGHLPPGLEDFNVYLMTVSPPDANGEVNFGDFQIMSKLCARNADLVIAEIDPRSIRVGGDNSMHISEIDYFVERTVGMPEIAAPPASEEERRTVDTISALVAGELIPDRATIQVGVGSTSGMLMSHLRGHHDLGMQTEIIPIGAADLVREGVLTGKHKKIFPGLVVGSGFATGTPREQLDYIDGNPGFQLYDFNFTDDIRTIAREEGLVSVNNALCVDLTGQVGSESVGHQMYTGHGRANRLWRRRVIGRRQIDHRAARKRAQRRQACLPHHAEPSAGDGFYPAARLRPLRGDRVWSGEARRQVAARTRARTRRRRASRLPRRVGGRGAEDVRMIYG